MQWACKSENRKKKKKECLFKDGYTGVGQIKQAFDTIKFDRNWYATLFDKIGTLHSGVANARKFKSLETKQSNSLFKCDTSKMISDVEGSTTTDRQQTDRESTDRQLTITLMLAVSWHASSLLVVNLRRPVDLVRS